ncbi:MAG: hypothetical protein ACLSAC_20515 [Enterocloster bolteae]
MDFTIHRVWLSATGERGTYAGASLWNPGDGSGEMDDPEGLKRARALGAKMADLTKRLNLDN